MLNVEARIPRPGFQEGMLVSSKGIRSGSAVNVCMWHPCPTQKLPLLPHRQEGCRKAELSLVKDRATGG